MYREPDPASRLENKVEDLESALAEERAQNKSLSEKLRKNTEASEWTRQRLEKRNDELLHANDQLRGRRAIRGEASS